jgi:hypothetical protein
VKHHLSLRDFFEHDIPHDAEGDVDHLQVGLAQQGQQLEGQALVDQML